MKTSRIALAFSALLAVGVIGAKAQNIGASLSNTMDQLGWHVGGTLEVVSGGTFRLDTGTKTATAVAGAATLNKLAGVVTSEPLTTAAGANYMLTLTDSTIGAADQVFVSVDRGTATTGTPTVTFVHPLAGSVVIGVRNVDSAAAFNGTIKLQFATIKN